MTKNSAINWKLQLRKFHQTVAPIVLIPLIITVFTGTCYRLGRDWFGLSKEQSHWLMAIHQADYLGDNVRSFYVLLNGLGLLWMIITGISMIKINKKPASTIQTSSEPVKKINDQPE
jgi:hypothetical protein